MIDNNKLNVGIARNDVLTGENLDLLNAYMEPAIQALHDRIEKELLDYIEAFFEVKA